MIFFGHLGPTLAVVKTGDKLVSKRYNKNKIDYRMVLLGSDLPDIIDKPIAILFRSVFNNTRLFGHTLLLTLILFLIGIFIGFKHKNFKNNFIILSVGCSIHLILDSMWNFKTILFWPLYGIRFPVRTDTNWAGDDFHRLLTDPVYYGMELLGLSILIYFFVNLIRKGKLKNFLRTGEL
jgi:membrane-bound metal-dependent hydrolase YbcI (DUF457 family)